MKKISGRNERRAVLVERAGVTLAMLIAAAAALLLMGSPTQGQPADAAEANGSAAGARSIQVEAESFDAGEPGVAFVDTDRSFGNRRSDVAVDVWEFDEEWDGASGALIGRTRDGEFTEYTVAVADAGDYDVRLSVASGAPDPGVIHVDVDGQRLGTVDGDTERWFDWSTRSAGIATLDGTHTVRLTWDRGANVNLDWFEIAPVGPQSPTCSTTAVEAETATFAGRFTTGLDPSASAGAFAHVPRGTGGSLNGHNDSYVEFCLGVTESGAYRLDTALRAPTDLDNSFYVSVDHGPLVDFVAQPSEDFRAATVNDAAALDPIEAADADEPVIDVMTWDLDAGDHTVRFYLRRDGTELDNVRFTRVVEASGCVIDGGAVDTVATQSECDALLALYEATDGPNWGSNDGWATATDPCSWYGVICGGGIAELDLFDNGLEGPIPGEVGDLSSLTILHLGNDRITGPIPAELSELTNLTQLMLVDSELSGSIPPALGRLANLRVLEIRDNRLTGAIPPELGQLSNLTELRLNANQLTGPIPIELTRLTNLQLLRFDNNQLTGPIPPELGDLTELYLLYLVDNQFTGTIPDELGNLGNLTDLRLSSNQLTGPIPSELGDLGRLRQLVLRENQLTGPIPTELSQLNQLFTILLDDNNLTGSIPVELTQLTGLLTLGLSGNELTGTIPVELAQLADLDYLALHDNQLSGSIPVELAELTNLTSLRLNDNELTGPLPRQFAQLTRLRSFELENNNLSGDITEAILGPLTLIDEPFQFGLAGNGCLTVTDPAIAERLDAVDPEWADGCPRPPARSPQRPPPLDHAPVDVVPVAYPDVEPDDPWIDILRFEFDGVGTARVGEYPFGSPIEPVVDLISERVGAAPSAVGDVITWGEPTFIEIEVVDGRLAAFEVDLVNWAVPDPVFVGDTWLGSGRFLRPSFRGVDLLVPLAYDAEDRLIRCSIWSACLHQTVPGPESTADFVDRYSAGWVSPSELIVTGYYAARDANPLPVLASPGADDDVAYRTDPATGTPLSALGEPVEADGRTWIRVFSPDRLLEPAGFVDLALVEPTAPADARGPLPRLERPADLVALIGEQHPDPFDDGFNTPPVGSLRDLIGAIELGVPSSISALGRDSDGRAGQYLAPDGLSLTMSYSEPIGDDTFELRDIWRIEVALGMKIAGGNSGRCPFLEGGDDANLAKIVVDDKFNAITGYIWLDNTYVEVDVSDVSCDGNFGFP